MTSDASSSSARTKKKRRLIRISGVLLLFALIFLCDRTGFVGAFFRVAPDDPSTFGEGLNTQAAQTLNIIAQVLEHVKDIQASSVEHIVGDEFTCDSLRPSNLEPVFGDHRLSVVRTVKATDSSQKALSYRGPSGLVQSLSSLAQPFRDANDIHVKFKIFRTVRNGPYFVTIAYYHASGRGEEGTVEQTATWRCHWAITDAAPVLSRIEVEEFEEVTSHANTLFSDCTVGVLGSTHVLRDQLLYGIDYWRARIPAGVDIDFQGHHGLAVGDVNGDGLDDVYFCQPNGLPNRLFVQNEDGTATDISTKAGVDWLDDSVAALLIDLDNDDDQDLIIAVPNRLLIMSNDGHGHFTLQRTPNGPEWSYSLSSADYDRDGDLDIYICGFGFFGKTKRNPLQAALYVPTPLHDANNGAPNMLLRNDGDWQFPDVTQECGLNTNNRRFSHAAAWEDYDNDGDQDLYVANDYGRNNLYRNDDGYFVDVSRDANVEDIGPGMSVAWADYNNDGYMDLYVSNMFSSAGGRVMSDARFQNKLGEKIRAQFQRHARGNSLFLNSANTSFEDVSIPAGVTMGRWAWSSNFMDINNDGLEDLFVANGYVTNEKTDDL